LNKNIFLIIILFTISVGTGLYGINPGGMINNYCNLPEQDTIQERQVLYNGIIWTNRYHRIEGDQFLFSGFFMPGTVSINGKTFQNVRIKYNILEDEIITPVNIEDILQLNKEMVDSFSISFEDKIYRFINIRSDTLKDLTGYVNILYKGNTSFFVKHIKTITPSFTSKSDGNFIENHRMYLVKDNLVHTINGTRTLFRVLNADKEQIRNFIKKNKLRISKKNPESFVPVIRFYDSISQ
jgi:hypothetical protein